MSNEIFQKYRTGYEALSYKEISPEEYIFLREKNPESISDSYIIPPALGSPGFGKIFVDINYDKARFRNDINDDLECSPKKKINKKKPSLNTQIKKFRTLNPHQSLRCSIRNSDTFRRNPLNQVTPPRVFKTLLMYLIWQILVKK
jgi:hypothetical protein